MVGFQNKIQEIIHDKKMLFLLCHKNFNFQEYNKTRNCCILLFFHRQNKKWRGKVHKTQIKLKVWKEGGS